MENQKLKRLLQSVGFACFVEHYDDFKNCINKRELADKIYQINNNRKPDKNITRINSAIRLFNNHLEKEALIKISQSTHVSAEINNRALEILSKEK